MLLSLFLLALAQDPSSQPPSSSGDTLALAAEMAQEGRDEDALIAFQRIASANPNDHTARLWIGRLHERMGNAARAEAVYRSIVLEDPINVQAILGLGSALLTRNEASEAIAFLQEAERLDPQNLEVLSRLAYAHQQAGHETVALAYRERVVAIGPFEQYERLLEQAQLSYRHRYELRSSAEQFGDDIPNASHIELRVNYRLSDTLRVIGRGDYQRKFDFSDARGGGGLEWRWKPQTTLIGQAIVGPDNRVMPEGDYLGAIDYTYRSTGLTGSFRYFDFTGARVWVVSPAARWWVTDRLAAGLTYALTLTETAITSGTDAGHSAMLRGEYLLTRRYTIEAGYARGVENFENYSIDRIGDFKANTATIGVRVQLPNLMSVTGGYTRQWRKDSLEDMNRFSVLVGQRF